jgi:hypothetical protein
MDNEENKEEEKTKVNTKNKWIPLVVCILAIVLAIFISSKKKTTSDIVEDAVKDLKGSIELPAKVDEFTTLTDVTAQGNSIRYQYTLSSTTDTSAISNESIKNSLKGSLCKDSEMHNLLRQNISFEYSYEVENSNQTYFIPFKYSDCL